MTLISVGLAKNVAIRRQGLHKTDFELASNKQLFGNSFAARTIRVWSDIGRGMAAGRG